MVATLRHEPPTQARAVLAQAVAQVQPLLPGLQLDWRAETGSTNADALAHLRKAAEGAATPLLMLAERQTAGRGRLGRPWWSEPGASLTFSLALPYAPRQWDGLSLAVGLALAEALDPLPGGADAAPRLGLKWPNDLWMVEGDRKLGGILIETVALPGLPSSPPAAPAPAVDGAPGPRGLVIGIGLNLRREVPAGVDLGSGYASVAELPGWAGPAGEADAAATLARLLPGLLVALQRFEHAGFAPLRPAYARRDRLAGRRVQAGEVQGLARGVDDQGQLLIESADGRLQLVQAGEVSVRPC